MRAAAHPQPEADDVAPELLRLIQALARAHADEDYAAAAEGRLGASDMPDPAPACA